MFCVCVGDENEFFIGLVIDLDVGNNFVVENVDVGIVVGVMVFVNDLDVIDIVMYEILDINFFFVIDFNIGVIIVGLIVDIDWEMVESIDVMVCVILSDGLIFEEMFIVDVCD